MKQGNPFKVYHSPIKEFVKTNGGGEFDDQGSFVPTKKGGEFFGTTVDLRKINIWLVFLFFGIFVIILRIGYLQIVKGESFKALAEENRIRLIDIIAKRGLIYDRNEKILVKNEPNFLFQIIPVDIPHDDVKKQELIEKASFITKKPSEEIKKIIDNTNKYSYEPEIIGENLNYEEAIQTKILSHQISGVSLGIATRRDYLIEDTSSLSHILGYLGRISEKEIKNYGNEYTSTDYVGKNGIESQYQEILKGKKGREQIEVDSFGRKKEKLAHLEPISGDDLLLTIDFNIQKKLEESLESSLKRNNFKRASAIAMDPRNGEILALVSMPSFDNNKFSTGITEAEFKELLENPDNPLFNRSITGQYPSGSTFKPIVALAALEEGIVNRWTTVQSVGGIRVSSWFFPDWKAGGHGNTNITKALAESVNTYFYYIGGGYQNFNGLGVDRIIKYSSLSGVGKKTGIDLPGESSGLLPNEEWKEKTKNEQWYIGDTYHLAIGQGDILATPLQVANWTSIVANGGTLYRPHIVRRIISNNKKGVKKIELYVINKNIFKNENIKIVQEGMRDAVTYGSARNLYDLPIEVAGKTGTAQWSSIKKDHAWFTGFAPYENPTIVLTILIEEGGEGSSTAVPIAKDFYAWWAHYDESK